MAKKRYIAMVEDRSCGQVTQYAETPRNSLSSSGRWTDAKLYSNKKEADEAAKKIVDRFRKDEREHIKPFVRTVDLEPDNSTRAKKDKTLRPNPFEGADDIYTTKNKIAVTKTKKKRTKRGFTKTTQTKYYEQNDSNLKLLKKAQGDAVRSGRKGTQIKRI